MCWTEAARTSENPTPEVSFRESSRKVGDKARRAGARGPTLIVEAAGVEPASANAPSVRFYERSSRF